MYAPKTIRAHGLNANALWDVTRAKLVSQLLYASPAWWGYLEVLGPLLFLIYINDIGNSISGIPIKLFADDTNLFIFSESIDVLKIDAEDKIKLLNSWFVANKLSLSLDKTCYSIYSIYGSTDTEH